MAYVPVQVHKKIHELVGEDEDLLLMAAYVYNSTVTHKEGADPEVSVNGSAWRDFSASTKAMMPILQKLAEISNMRVQTFVFKGKGNKYNRLTTVDLALHKLLLEETKKSCLDKLPAIHITKSITYEHLAVEPFNRVADQQLIKLYLKNIPDHVLDYTPTEFEDIRHAIIMSRLKVKPIYESKNSTYRIYDSTWSFIPRTVRDVIYPNFIELDLRNGYLAIVEMLCRKNNIPCITISEILKAQATWRQIFSSIQEDYLAGRCTYGVPHLPKEYKNIKEQYLLKSKQGVPLASLEEYYTVEYVIQSEFPEENAIDRYSEKMRFEKYNEKNELLKDCLKTVTYMALFGSGRKNILEELLAHLDPDLSLMIYGSPYLEELTRVNRDLGAAYDFRGLRDAYGRLHQGQGDGRQSGAPKALHEVCSSYELALVAPAYKAAQKRSDGWIALHQHDGIAVKTDSQEFLDTLKKAVDSKAEKMDINTRFVEKTR